MFKKILLGLVACLLAGSAYATTLFSCSFDESADANPLVRWQTCATNYGLTGTQDGADIPTIVTGQTGQGILYSHPGGNHVGEVGYDVTLPNPTAITVVYYERYDTWPLGSNLNAKSSRLFYGSDSFAYIYGPCSGNRQSDLWYTSNSTQTSTTEGLVTTGGTTVVPRLQLNCAANDPYSGLPSLGDKSDCDNDFGFQQTPTTFTMKGTNDNIGRVNAHFTVGGVAGMGTNWRKIRYYVQMPSSVSVADGKITLWIDEVLIYTLTGVGRQNNGGDTLTRWRILPSDEDNAIPPDGSGPAYGHYIDEITIYSGYVPPAGSDGTPPSTVTDLAVTSTGSTSANLTWTPPTDNVGVTSYQVKYKAAADCTTMTTQAQFNAATSAVGVPAPPAGAMTVTNLTPSTAYCFAIESQDAAGNSSAISTPNPDATTQGPPPGLNLYQSTTVDAGVGQSANITLASPSLLNNGYVLVVRAGATGENFTVIDTAGNGWTQLHKYTTGNDTETVAVFLAPHVIAAKPTVTVTDSALATLRVVLAEFSGMATTVQLDGTPAEAEGTSTAPLSGSSTSVLNGDLAIGVIGTANGGTVTQQAGWTKIADVPGAGSTKLSVEYFVQTVAGALTAGGTLSPSQPWNADIVLLGGHGNCGNGTIDAGEGCDDGNVYSGDGCSEFCAVENGWACSGTPSACGTVCGDGIIAGNEQCDGSNFGLKTCLTYGCSAGNLTCTACQIDTSTCQNCTGGRKIGR